MIGNRVLGISCGWAVGTNWGSVAGINWGSTLRTNWGSSDFHGKHVFFLISHEAGINWGSTWDQLGINCGDQLGINCGDQPEKRNSHLKT